mmetsp:Transcript_20817/g.27073  ORF Transcript_20817/g.27073 Transcript_20817/m.27073 type:complete len:425 (-) Transcript_20817:102-1376(-)
MGNNIATQYCPCYDLPPVTTIPQTYSPEVQSNKRTNKKTQDTLSPLPPPSHQHQHIKLNSTSLKPPSFRSAGTPQAQQAAFEAKYELLNVIGNGSTSQVRRCRDRFTRQEYACKVIDKKKVHPQYSPVMTQFENEIEVLMKLQQIQQHPNIIHLEDVYITSTSILMIMELMQGGELFDYVVQRGTLSEEEASTMIRKVTSAVSHMHDQGIIHRDLKPENLLLTKIGPGAEIKIIDFGLSKMIDISNSNTQSFLGTRGYLAPEMLKRQAYSASVDVWALGVISFILLCGCLPFDDDSTKINEETAKMKFQLRFPHWAQGISDIAKDFLKLLLNPDAKLRATSKDALEHPWLAETMTTLTKQEKQKLLASPKHIRAVIHTNSNGETTSGGEERQREGNKNNNNEGNNTSKTKESGIGAKIKRNGSF